MIKVQVQIQAFQEALRSMGVITEHLAKAMRELGTACRNVPVNDLIIVADSCPDYEPEKSN